MSDIEWTDQTWNPIIGCELVSPGCALCYAGTMAKRQVGMAQGRRTKWARSLTPEEAARWVNEGVEPEGKKRPQRSPYVDVINIDEPGKKRRTGAAVWNGLTRFLPERLAEPLRWRKPRMVFAPSMSDFFHPSVAFNHIAAILGVMAATPQHTYQVLTKRPARLLEFLRWLRRPVRQGLARLYDSEWQPSPLDRCWGGAVVRLGLRRGMPSSLPSNDVVWPLPNVWFGVSVEDQKRADERLPLLAEVRAMGWHTFVSAEPLIGPIVDGQWSAAEWVIIGGESGAKARRCEGEWIRRVRDDAHAVSAAVFVKQLGLRFDDRRPLAPGAPRVGAGLDVHATDEVWLQRLNSRKGNDPAEWPVDLRVREWPAGMEPGL